MSQPGAGDGRSFQIINPPNTLQKKAGSGGVDASAVKKAEKVFESLRGEFETNAKNDVAKLAAASAALMANPFDINRRQEVYMLAHELRGQGGSYGYPLVTKFGDQLCRFLDATDMLDAKGLVIVKAAADAIAVVINSAVVGDGGETGRQLGAMLDKALAMAKGEA
ncbi:MAG: hypothetical protein GC202_05755 [Alphaproteobacteria bacterium]|nr:hypothetical protein [Alphaproteobacteria bacterium]